MALSFTENRARNIGLSVTTNPRTVLNSVGLLEATQAEAIAGAVQNRYISPLRLDQTLEALGIDGSYAVGDLIYASTTSLLSGLAAVATGQVLISNGVNTAPSWSADPTLSTLWASKTVTAVPSDAGGSTNSVNLFRVAADNVAAGSGFIIGQQRRYVFGGSSVTGGRISGYDFVANTATTAAGNTNRNYVAHVGVAYSAVGDGGTNTGAGALGAYFGSNPSVHLDNGATNVFHAAGQEVDITLSTGSSARYATGSFIAGFNAVRGSEVDCALGITGGTGHVGFKHGILFTDIGDTNPFYASSVLIGSYWQGSTPTVDKGVDLTGFTITTSAFASTGFSVDGSGNITGNAFNKVAITAPATSATLTIANGKTLTVSNTLTFTGTDASSVAFGTGGTVPYIGAANTWTASNIFSGDTTVSLVKRIESANTFSTGLTIQKRGTTGDSAAAITSGTEIGYHSFFGWDGAAYGRGAYAIAESTEAFATNSHGSRYSIATTANGANDATVHFRVNQDGTVSVLAGTFSPAAGTTAIAPITMLSGTNLTTAAAGAVEYDGKCFYATSVASSRQVVNAEQISILAAGRNLTDGTGAQNVFGTSEDVISLAASTTYEFEALYIITRTAGTTAHTISTLFAVGSALTGIMYLATISNPTGNVLGAASQIHATAATATVVTASNNSATENIRIYLRGTMRTNAASTITPQVEYSAAPGGTPAVAANSFFRCWPIGTNTVAAVGNWA